MSGRGPVVVLVHGAFAGSASWNSVIELLPADSIEVVAVANPLRGIGGDAAYVRDVIVAIGRPVILVAHSYGGMVITEAAADNDAVKGLVYVCAYAPESGEGAFHGQFAADVPAGQAATMCATQRPITEAALTAGLPTDAPAHFASARWRAPPMRSASRTPTS